MTARTRRVRWYYERRIFLLAVLAGLPGSAVALLMLWTQNHDPKVQWTLTVLITGCWLGFAGAVRERVVFPLRTLSNLLAALQEGDFSVRARGAEIDDALGEVMQQVNSMGGTLREQRLGALEATTLLRKVMEEIDVAIFAFDSEQKLRLVNRAGEKLLAKPAERLTGRSAAELDLAECLEGDPARVVQTTFPSGPGRWGMRRSTFREHGLPMQLVVIGDLTRPLREEELAAWQRLVRVLGHELNNSLTPIKSIAGSLENLVASETLPPDWLDDMRRGLAVISARSESLSRFIGAYARLAKLPRPTLAPLDIAPWVRRVVGLETRLHVDVQPGPDVVIHGDADQLEQLLINVLRNATDAALETGGGVRVGWRKNASYVEVKVEDDGPGLSNTSNLFVPFFTTKPGGSGIGLVLSRQIAEAHGGALTLENRRTGSGCEARLRLPI
ncbi:MAG: PAS domain-containing sensor histidine kinase [Acidobacteriia bacterium]|nr:PAS domain-containing sensor histidine kinase [Terriglobia bacterium]